MPGEGSKCRGTGDLLDNAMLWNDEGQWSQGTDATGMFTSERLIVYGEDFTSVQKWLVLALAVCNAFLVYKDPETLEGQVICQMSQR